MEEVHERPNMYKLVITGPESTGKTTLSKQLSNYLNVEMVEEYARTYLQELSHPYTQDDLLKIAKGQLMLENRAILNSNKEIIICDTSLEVIKIWSEFKYNSCHSFISTSLTNTPPNVYLLMAPDLPWKFSPLRENPTDRGLLFTLYKKELISSKVPFYEISGKGSERLNKAKLILTKILNE